MHALFRQSTGFGGGAPDGGGPTCEWRLRRNCSMSPAQSVAVFGVLVGMMLATGVLFWVALDAWPVLVYAFAISVAVGAAFFVYALHAADGEVLTLGHSRLVVDVESGGRHRVYRLDLRRVTVATDPAAEDAVFVRSGDERVRVGAWLPRDARRAFAIQLATEIARHTGRWPMRE